MGPWLLARLRAASDRLYALVNWFIPERLKADADVVQAARMFLFSHFFGPFLGHTISIYVLVVQGRPDAAWVVLFVAITLFWPFSLVLRATGWYVPLAFISIQNLLFCILWGCYHYGGASSPFLPWLITVPLLAFFYLPSAKTRILVSLQIVANLIGFYFIHDAHGFPDTIALSALSGLGFVSTFSAGMYVSMMALYYANIVSSQSELEDEVLRHRRTAQALGEATEQVQRAVRAKSEFLANMSHELRTPLNAIIGYSEMLIEDTEADDQQAADLQAINGAGQRLLGLINELLDLSKLEAGKMELHPEDFALDGFLDEIVAAWREKIAASGNELRVERPADLGRVFGDATKLRQVVVHLLDNATKYAPGGRITIAASNRGGEVVLAVRDTGRGIDPVRVVHLFETFGRQDGETSSTYRDDTGLGLPLAQRLCRLMQGDLAAESPPGRGAGFTVRIPTWLARQPDAGSHGRAAADAPAAAAGGPLGTRLLALGGLRRARALP